MAYEPKLAMDDESVRQAFALQTPYALEDDDDQVVDAREAEEAAAIDRQIFAGLVTP